jgi:hypothetical protein
MDRGILARVGGEIGILDIARVEPFALERAADAFGDRLHQPLKLGRARCRHGQEAQAGTLFESPKPE